ncbi:TPA: hypothetical protein DD445_02460 [Candidatus Nomurabacteria bacterium]|nr:hypothetical protein [Candidatus Nomurabacteria bacterium]HBR66114.1 hypothetical protein [Candidatus Nomurabacteria bacterium]
MIYIAHSFVNIFAGGRSNIKVHLLILYFISISIFYFLFRKNTTVRPDWKWFGITLLISYFYGLFLHIFYLLQNNLHLTDFIIIGNNKEISSSTIWHTHIAKGVIGQIFSFFDKTYLQTMDAGGAYIGLIPSPILLAGTMLFVALILQTIFYFITSFKELLNNKNKRQKIFLIFGYSIISFSLIKTSIDGGILNPSFSISLIFITLFILRTKGKVILNYYYLISLAGILLLASSLYVDSFKYGSGIYISSIATLLLLYGILLYGSEEKIRLQFFIPLLILFLSGWWVSSIRDREIYNYGKINLEQGKKIYIYNEEKELIENQILKENKKISSISKELNKNITYTPLTIPGITCILKSPRQNISFELKTKEPIKNLSSSSDFIYIKNSESSFNGKNWTTQVNFFMNNCTPEPLSIINGELLKNNINKYFIVNPTFDDTYNH